MRRAACAIFVLFGCTGTREAPPAKQAPPPGAVVVDPLPKTGPPTHWSGTTLVVDGRASWTLELRYEPGGEITLALPATARWPHGTRVHLGPVVKALDGTGTRFAPPFTMYGSFPIAAGAAAPAAVTFAPVGSLSIVLPNQVTLEVPLPADQISGELSKQVMSAAKDAPFSFAGEVAHEGARSTYYLDAHEAPAVVGPGQRLSDIEWIAVATDDAGTKEATRKVTIVERITNATIATKTFARTGHTRDDVLAWIRTIAEPADALKDPNQ